MSPPNHNRLRRRMARWPARSDLLGFTTFLHPWSASDPISGSEALMRCAMAAATQRDQVGLTVIAMLTPVAEMADLQLAAFPAPLAAPNITLQHPLVSCR